MGCSIDVHWLDGPITNEVQALLDRFDSKSFDGMTDSTSHHTQEYEGEVVSFGADYVTGSRELSTAFLRQIACKVATQYGVAVPEVYNWAEDEGKDHGSIRSTPESQVLDARCATLLPRETVNRCDLLCCTEYLSAPQATGPHCRSSTADPLTRAWGLPQRSPHQKEYKR